MIKGNGKIANAETLDSIVERVAKLFDEQKELAADIKTLANSAWEPHGVSSKAIKQLAKEKRMGEVAREARRQYEEQLHQARERLGMLFDTPLGQAAMAEAAYENQDDWNDEAEHDEHGLMLPAKKKAQRDAKGAQRKKAARGKKKSDGGRGQPDWPV